MSKRQESRTKRGITMSRPNRRALRRLEDRLRGHEAALKNLGNNPASSLTRPGAIQRSA